MRGCSIEAKRFTSVILTVISVGLIVLILFDVPKESFAEPVIVNFTCPFDGVVRLDSSILVCKNAADLYCKDGKVVCMKEITHPEVVTERLCIVVC